jgi:outer membrane protein OmpA-like peptidoglycan-associated protein
MLKIKHNKRLFVPLIILLIVSFYFTGTYSQKLSKLINLTLLINTDGDDYAPSLTEDGSLMVFNSKMPQERSHNIFICKNKDGRWGEPYPVFEINSDSNEETPFISADGKTIVFSSDRPGGFSPPVTSDGKKRITYDIYISHLVNGKWTEPELLPGTVNTNMNERAPGLSRDGKTIYFTRWPYNTPSKSKIYSATLDGGKYINVKELPGIINSGNFEIGFRPSYRSNRYYFSSRKKGGSGGWDIYYTALTEQGFSVPVNAGKEINTPYDDMYYSESKSNSVLCSDKAGGFGGFDLYSSIAAIPGKKASGQIKSKKHVKTGSTAGPVTKLKITVREKKRGKPVKYKTFMISLIGNREKESVTLRTMKIKTGRKGYFTLNPKDDVDYILIEPSNSNNKNCRIKIRVIPEQFQDITVYLNGNLKKNKKNSCMESDYKESVVEVENDQSSSLELKYIYFKVNSSEIAPTYIPGLHAIVQQLRNNPQSQIIISGYTDPKGSEKYNEKLSMKRANAVADFLKSMDIPEERISVKWYGESGALSKNKGPRHYGLDRKVELEIK